MMNQEFIIHIYRSDIGIEFAGIKLANINFIKEITTMNSVNASINISSNVNPNTTDCANLQSNLPVTNVHNPPSLTDLPEEIIVKIASNLFPKDYGNFRQSCKAVNTINPSFGVMGKALKDNVCSGRLKINFEKFVYGNDIDHVLQQCTAHIKSALKNISIKTKSSGKEEYTIMKARYFPVDLGKKNCIGSWIIKNFYYLLSGHCASSSQRSFLPAFYPGELAHIRIDFRNWLLDNSTIDHIFCLANTLCEDIKTPEQMVMFSMINELKNYWCENPLDNVTKEKIIELSENYPRLFNRNYLLQLISYRLSTQE